MTVSACRAGRPAAGSSGPEAHGDRAARDPVRAHRLRRPTRCPPAGHPRPRVLRRASHARAPRCPPAPRRTAGSVNSFVSTIRSRDVPASTPMVVTRLDNCRSGKALRRTVTGCPGRTRWTDRSGTEVSTSMRSTSTTLTMPWLGVTRSVVEPDHEERRVGRVEAAALVAECRGPDIHPDFRSRHEPLRGPEAVRLVADVGLSERPADVGGDPGPETRTRPACGRAAPARCSLGSPASARCRPGRQAPPQGASAAARSPCARSSIAAREQRHARRRYRPTTTNLHAYLTASVGRAPGLRPSDRPSPTGTTSERHRLWIVDNDVGVYRKAGRTPVRSGAVRRFR